MAIEQFYLGGLGHQSYLITDEGTGQAAVVDPRRDVAIYLEAAAARGARITHILETHVHNDYITGARELAAHTTAVIATSAAAGVGYAQMPVRDGERIVVGQTTFTALATPGHTPDHLSYSLTEPGQTEPAAVFTGGSLLAGSAGRTDLLGEGQTLTLTRQQYRSLRRLLDTLPGQVMVYPTHGAGSFCGASTLAPRRSSTIAEEREISPAMTAADEDDFVRRQLASFGPYPAYYQHMGAINRAGPALLGARPPLPALTPAAILGRMQAGVPLVDGRSRQAFAAAFIPGALNIELGDEDFATYVGWLLPFNSPLTILVEDEAGRREAVVQLLRIGYEHVEGYLDGGIRAWEAAALPIATLPRIDVLELARRLGRGEPLAVVDVRRPDEWCTGHIPGSIHAHVAELSQQIDALPTDRPIAVICHGGFRAAIGASMIASSGRAVIAIQGGVPDWIAAGYPSEHEPEMTDPTAGDQNMHGHL